MATIRDILIHNKVYSMDLELALLRHLDGLRQNPTKHYICPTCQRFVKEGLDKCDDNYRHFGRINTYRGEGGNPL